LASRNYVLENLRANYHQRIAREILNITAGPQLLPIKAHLRRGLGRRNSPVLTAVPPGTVPQDAFVEITKDFIQESFRAIKHLRPGEWVLTTSQPTGEVGEGYPVDDVRYLQAFLRRHAEVRSAPWADFFITPDITIGRLPVTDTEINMEQELVTERGELARHTPLRLAVNTKSILHASVSCKWTIRSDRSQNTRTEALNLIRNRKGKVPIVVAVVFEPLPTRIASIALGTGDLDCVYHGALHFARRSRKSKTRTKRTCSIRSSEVADCAISATLHSIWRLRGKTLPALGFCKISVSRVSLAPSRCDRVNPGYYASSGADLEKKGLRQPCRRRGRRWRTGGGCEGTPGAGRMR